MSGPSGSVTSGETGTSPGSSMPEDARHPRPPQREREHAARIRPGALPRLVLHGTP